MSNKKRTRTRSRNRMRGTVSTTSTVSKSGVKGEEEETISKELDIPIESDNPAYVKVDGGMTKNLGDFNSARIGVSVTLPCEPNEEAVRECYNKATSLVDEFLDDEYSKAVGER